jgi:DNA-binding LacI/PurR family transcriptional regulator
MADVASAANASSREVTLVVAGDPRVAPPIRQRIVDVIHAIGYKPLGAAQAGRGRPLRFAIVQKVFHGEDPEGNRFYVPVESAIAMFCAANGAEIVPATMAVGEQYDVLELPALLTDGSCDGAFLVGGKLDSAAIERVRAATPAIVLVDGYSQGDIVDSVVTDNVAGGRMAVEHLVAAGHRDIAIVGTEPLSYPSMQGRRTGYTEALEAWGLPQHYIDISYVQSEAAGMLGVAYLQRHPEVTTVFGANDLITVALMQAAREASLRAPADLSLVGFDDIDLASLVMPALTTLAVDKALMGRAAFALLAHRLEAPRVEPMKAVVMPRLLERESVGPPRGR